MSKSYAGRLSCSIHFDAENVPGAVFASALADELERLSDLATDRLCD